MRCDQEISILAAVNAFYLLSFTVHSLGLPAALCRVFQQILFVFLRPNKLFFNASVTDLLYATWKKLENDMETGCKRNVIDY